MYIRPKIGSSCWYNILIRDTAYTTVHENKMTEEAAVQTTTTKTLNYSSSSEVVIELEVRTNEGALVFYNLLAEQLVKVQIAMTIRKLEYYGIRLQGNRVY